MSYATRTLDLDTQWRMSTVCPGCGETKEAGLDKGMVCWNCFKGRNNKPPLKYWCYGPWHDHNLGLATWLMELRRPHQCSGAACKRPASSLWYGQYVCCRCYSVIEHYHDRGIQIKASLTGEEIATLMRLHQVTIKQVAEYMQVAQGRVRKMRDEGISGNNWMRDWVEGIVGAAFEQFETARIRNATPLPYPTFGGAI